MVDKKELEKVFNKLLKRKYPFIENVEVYRLRKMNDYNLDLDVNIYISREDMVKMVDFDCIDNIPDYESIFMSLFSFGLCSKGVLKRAEFEDLLLKIYKGVSGDANILIYVPSINVIAPSVSGEF